jgi:hypothetical protein
MMDTQTFRLLATLSAHMGEAMTINQLVASTKEAFGTAHYANVYHKVQDLKEAGWIITNRAGNAYQVQLNFDEYLLPDVLSEMEITRKIKAFHARPALDPLFKELESRASARLSIASIAVFSLEKNYKLNRIELVVLLKETADYRGEIARIHEEFFALQKKHNVKIDSLVLNNLDLGGLLLSREDNPIKEMVPRMIVFFGAQAFWKEIGRIGQGGHVQLSSTETRLAKMPAADMVFNLNRFGYKEFGTTIGRGTDACIETITIALFLQTGTRYQEAVSIILAKNAFKSNLLAFLSQKHGVAGRLLSVLKVLQEIKPRKDIAETIEFLIIFENPEILVDKQGILQAMETYHAT